MGTPNGPPMIPSSRHDQTSPGRGRQERRLDPVIVERDRDDAVGRPTSWWPARWMWI